ncbi:hypothetical protein BMS3Abin04_03047 [bacterium BMS3Abin04]|nr:hypothetical protein BMS3Abin04_03047 [bacterium BMS3Abin04]
MFFLRNLFAIEWSDGLLQYFLIPGPPINTIAMKLLSCILKKETSALTFTPFSPTHNPFASEAVNVLNPEFSKTVLTDKYSSSLKFVAGRIINMLFLYTIENYFLNLE